MIDIAVVLEVAKWVTALGVILATINKMLRPIKEFNSAMALMQRERLESAYTVYVNVLGWCPSGEKSVLEAIYRHYKEGGNNHIAENYLEVILELPEHPK